MNPWLGDMEDEDIEEFVDAIFIQIELDEANELLTDGIIEAGLKFDAEMMLIDKRLSVPTLDEWMGLALLERDDEI